MTLETTMKKKITIVSRTVPNGAGQIYLYNCTNVTIDDQNLFNNTIGIITAYSSYLTIQNNIIYNSRWGIIVDKDSSETTVTNNTMFNNYGDIQLWGAYNNIVNFNALGDNSHYAIAFDAANNNIISNNTIFETEMSGIILWGGTGNTITQNSFLNNVKCGVNLDDASNDNFVRFNDFFGNNLGGAQATDNGTNNIFSYNYWSDWTSPDSDNDGIVDSPYVINGFANNFDPHPLALPNPPDSCLLLGLMILHPNGGETVNGMITIRWSMSADSFGHEFTYVVYYSVNGGWHQLSPVLTTTSYLWNTNAFPDGSTYRITVEAICTAGHAVEDTSDDMFTIQNDVPIITSTTTATTPTGTTLISTSAAPVTVPTPGMTVIMAILSLLPILILKKVKQKNK